MVREASPSICMALLASVGFNSLSFFYLLQLSENFVIKSEQKTEDEIKKKEKKSLVNKRIYFNNSPNSTTSEMITSNTIK